MSRPTVAIAGGGLAGLSAACELAEAGFAVTLLEKRPFLGGRSYSYVDRETGTDVDNGQHVFLGCCTEFIRFLERIGARDGVHLQDRFHVPVIDKVWGESELRAADLRPPLHLLPSLLRYKSLSPAEKAMAGWALSQIRATKRENHPELDSVTFEEWLRANRQSPRAIRSLWNLIVLPTLNEDISRVSADLALMVFQEGFLRSRGGANVGWAKMGLSRLLAAAARRYIEARGGEIRLETATTSVEVTDGRVSGLITDAGEVKADAYVLALPVEATPSVLPDALRRDEFFGRIGWIETAPIVNVHLWYDRPVWERDFAAFLNTPVQWIFNKTRLWGLEGDGQYLDISLSGADDFVDLPAADIAQLFGKELFALLPASRDAEIARALVVKQRNATFRPAPRIAELRPTQRTPVPNLYLAGDWTDTGWPATMESAVRSGLLAAGEVQKAAPALVEEATTA